MQDSRGLETVRSRDQVGVGGAGGREVIMAVSGIGMVNAAMTTQQLIDKWPSVKTIIFRSCPCQPREVKGTRIYIQLAWQKRTVPPWSLALLGR